MPEAAPAPMNPGTNGTKARETPSQGPAPTKDIASGPEKVKTAEEVVDLGDGNKMTRAELNSLLGRAKHSSKMLTEAQKRLEQATAKENAQKQKIERQELEDWFKEKGWTADQAKQKASDWLYQNFIEPEQLTQEQKSLREKERQLKELESKLKGKEDLEKEEALKKATQAETQKLEAEILSALDSQKIPETEAGIRRIAAWIAKFEQAGESITVDQAAALAKEDIGKETGEFAEHASLDELRELWGEKAFKSMEKKFLDYSLGRLTGQGNQSEQSKGKSFQSQPSGERKRMTPEQFMDQMRRR